MSKKNKKIDKAEKMRMQVLDKYWAKVANEGHRLAQVADKLNCTAAHLELLYREEKGYRTCEQYVNSILLFLMGVWTCVCVTWAIG